MQTNSRRSSDSLVPDASALDQPEVLHARLAAFNHARLEPGMPTDGWLAEMRGELAMRALEEAFLAQERQAVAARAASAPTDAHHFVTWFESLERTGPGQHDPLFPWLATRADRAQLRWFLAQEVAGEAGFDDLVALTQIKMPVQPKLELARNYWDEMGRGTERAMHGPMLSRLADAMDVAHSGHAVVHESLALGNLMAGLASSRRYAYHSIGALGVIELTAPGRAEQVNLALKRLGVDASARQYFALHATLDVKHSQAWNREVIGPLVASDPRLARPIAEGALMRLEAGARCFRRYRRELGLDACDATVA